MKALAILAFVGPICVVAFYGIRALSRHQSAPERMNRELVKAIRLLDRAAEADAVMPYMSSDLRADVQRTLARYREREINS